MPPNKDAPGCLGSPPGLICLPPISEDLQLVWTQAAQTSDLDGNQHLLQTFSYFPYPSLSDLALLCLRHGLHMEKVKAWFMAQRLRCGISWSAEEIEETRARLIYHQDQLHFSSLLSGNDGSSWHQSCKGQEYYQAVPALVHQPNKYLQSQQTCAASLSYCSPAQGMRVLGKVTQDAWEQKGSVMSHYYKAQEKCEPSGMSVYFYNTKEMNSGPHLPTTTTSPDYHFQNSHTAAWRNSKAPLQPTESVPSALNGEPRPVMHPAGPSVKAAPPSHAAAANAEPCGLQSCQFPASDQQPTSGSGSDVLRKPRRKTKEQLDVLKSFFLRCQWARREDYYELEKITGLPRSEIIQWFGDTRYALKHGQLKWFRDNAGQSPESAAVFLPPPHHASQPNTSPLERYWATHLQLQEHDLPVLCRESGLEAEQVLKWFNSRLPAPCEVEVCLGEEDEVDEEVAAAMVKVDDEDYEEEEDEEDDDDDDDWTA